jgi:hypothetical protein
MACFSPYRLAQDFAYIEVTCNGKDFSYGNVQVFYHGTDLIGVLPTGTLLNSHCPDTPGT